MEYEVSICVDWGWLHQDNEPLETEGSEGFELSKPLLDLTPIVCATTKVIQKPIEPWYAGTRLTAYHLPLTGSRMDYL